MESMKLIWIPEQKSMISAIFSRKLALTEHVVLGRR